LKSSQRALTVLAADKRRQLTRLLLGNRARQARSGIGQERTAL